jgi:alpha-D-xyloside xylohydrolase
MGILSQDQSTLMWREGHNHVWLTAVGRDGIRVQSNLSVKPLDLPQALLDPKPITPKAGSPCRIEIDTDKASFYNGKIRAEVWAGGRIRFFNAETGRVLLEEPYPYYTKPPSRHFKHNEGDLYQIEAWFDAQNGERFFGLGQHQHGHLDNKGCVIDLQQRNTEVCIPIVISNRMYGFLWNNPGIGRVELGMNATRWVANATRQLDYYVFEGDSYPDLLEKYADLTGHAPEFPEWASGFWQCKLRYETQDDLLKVAREYKKRGLPISVIVSDFFNWSHMGDWRFDPKCWPDPAAMTKELSDMGIKMMVSIWPSVSPISENYPYLKEQGLLIHNETGVDAQQVFVDHGINGPAYYPYYDATNPDARKFIWDTVKKSYYAQGVKLFWLDNDEPDLNPWNPENQHYFLGNGMEVASIYPMLHQKAFYDGLRAAGETDFITLSRSGWAGSQRYQSVIWSGDIASSFEALQAQVRAGLNMAMSGIPWWTTDIGGFHGGDLRDEGFRELVVRWFQYAVFCPVFRLHGHRLPPTKPFPDTGADNEAWSFGDENYEIIKELMFLRERLRPYIHKQMQLASEKGLPMMRPVFVDYPEDPQCEEVDDEFMFGPDLLVAPVLARKTYHRQIYLPNGATWTNAWTGKSFAGGQTIRASAPLNVIPLYLRDDAQLPLKPEKPAKSSKSKR